MNIAFIDVYHRYHFEVIQKFIKNNYKIKYAITGSKKNFHGDKNNIEELSEKIFKEIDTIDSVEDFLSLDKLNDKISIEWTVDEDLIKSMKSAETYFLRLTDRNTAFPTPVQQRRQYYLILLNYFNTIIKENKIERAIVFDTPHGYSSYLFYCLLKYYNIKIIRLEHHFLQNYSLILDDSPLPEIPDDFCENENLEEIRSKIPDDFLKDIENYNEFISKANKNERKKLIYKGGVVGYIQFFSRFIKKSAFNITMGLFPFLFKNEILHFTSLNGIKNRFLYRLKINLPLFKLLKKNWIYNNLSTIPDLGQNYVFYGMHMQPEKTSQPLGGEFDNQLLPIKIISDSLPKGWKLYVKEHPNQFNEKKIVNNNYRDINFYKMIKSLKNVELVSLYVPSSDLIENAKMVSTLTGTLGWEALQKNIPVLAFGEAYYKSCKATCSPKSVEECKLAINDLLKMDDKSIQREIYRYFLFYIQEGMFVESSNWEEVFQYHRLPREKQIENLYQSMISKL